MEVQFSSLSNEKGCNRSFCSSRWVHQRLNLDSQIIYSKIYFWPWKCSHIYADITRFFWKITETYHFKWMNFFPHRFHLRRLPQKRMGKVQIRSDWGKRWTFSFTNWRPPTKSLKMLWKGSDGGRLTPSMASMRWRRFQYVTKRGWVFPSPIESFQKD